jgi:hypothetical protein
MAALLSVDQLAEKIPPAVAKLQDLLSGQAHGVLRGSCEAAIAEAQGAQIIIADGGGKTSDHITSLGQSLRALQNARAQISNLLGQLRMQAQFGNVPFEEVNDLSGALKPLTALEGEREAVMQETLNLVETLKATNPGRLAGVAFGQGGLGPEIGRTVQSLVTSQIQQLAPTLTSRGIEPSLVPSNLVGAAEELLEEIEEMPISTKAAAVEAAAAAAMVRASVTSLLARMTATASSTFLESVGGFLEAMWGVGGRLISFPLILFDKNGNLIGSPEPLPEA